MVWKILRAAEWAAAETSGSVPVSRDDARDGFVHLSAAGQIAGSLARHFADEAAVVLVAFDSAALGAALRWEASRGGALFPHFYGQLRTADAVHIAHVGREADGAFALPTDIA
jgi:uncharacterized protein (DUF952 family)